MRALSFGRGRLELLDTRRLPAEERFVVCEDYESVAEAIETTAVRGAPLIGVVAAYGVALGGAEKAVEAMERLRKTRPTGACLGAALSFMRRALEGGRELADAAEDWEERERRACERVAVNAGKLLRGRVLTICNTGALAAPPPGTALGAVAEAFARGAVESVLVCETRPLLQGARLTSYELARAGIPHTLIVDGAAAFAMSEGLVDVAITGADRIAANGDTANKVGTLALACAAQRFDVPFVVAATFSTMSPSCATGRDFTVEMRDESEVLSLTGERTAPDGARALNFAFDVTPRELITHIVTEEGACRTSP